MSCADQWEGVGRGCGENKLRTWQRRGGGHVRGGDTGEGGHRLRSPSRPSRCAGSPDTRGTASAVHGLPGPRGPGAADRDTPDPPCSPPVTLTGPAARDKPIPVRCPAVPVPGTPRYPLRRTHFTPLRCPCPGDKSPGSQLFLPLRPALSGVWESSVPVSGTPGSCRAPRRSRCPGHPGTPIPVLNLPTPASSTPRCSGHPGPGLHPFCPDHRSTPEPVFT